MRFLHRCSRSQGAIPYLVDLGVEGIQVDKQVDTCILKGTHTAAVVTSRVNMIYAYSIRSQLLHGGSIAFALALIEKRIGRDKLVGNSASW